MKQCKVATAINEMRRQWKKLPRHQRRHYFAAKNADSEAIQVIKLVQWNKSIQLKSLPQK